MRVFVLSTGRCGSQTFERACRHLTNYTAGHETRKGRLAPDRFAYPDQHIESDNRLSWFLGTLGSTFDPDQTFYVHLTRDREQVAASYLARWDRAYRPSMIRAFGHALLMRRRTWPEEQRMEVCRFYVDTVNDNIAAFLPTQRHTLTGDIAEGGSWFPEFLDRIGAEGDLDAAVSEIGVRHHTNTEREAQLRRKAERAAGGD